MKIGDKFKFNIELMENNNINIPKERDSIQTVMDVMHHNVLGTLIGYKRKGDSGHFAQINECWCTPV